MLTQSRQIRHEPRRLETELRDLLRLGDVSGEQNHAAEAELARQRLQFDRQRMAVESGDQQLADLSSQCARHDVRRLYDIDDQQPMSKTQGLHPIIHPRADRLFGADAHRSRRGTIDIWPLYLFHDGATTLNAAISLRAHAQIESRTTAASSCSRSTRTGASTRRTGPISTVERAAAAGAAGPSLPARERDADHARRVAGRRRHRGLVGADDRRLRRPGAMDDIVDGRRRPPAGRDERRMPDDPGADRRAGLSAGALRRHRGDRAARRRHPPRRRSTSTRTSSNSGSSWRTPARRATPARTTGKSPNATSTATATSSTASSVFATPRSPCGRRCERGDWDEVGPSDRRRNGTTANGWRRA